MPTAHQKYAEWSPERILRWAHTMGPFTAQLVDTLFDSRKHPEQAYRSCLGILRLGDRYSKERLEAACRRALPAGIRSYKGIKNILDAKLDQIEADQTTAATLPSHANIRGQTYFH